MKDAISQKRVSELHPRVKEDFLHFIEDAEKGLDITLRVVQGLRTFAEQYELYMHGRTKFFDAKGNKLGIVTKAKAGKSWHNYGCAIDVVPLINGRPNWSFNYEKLVKFMPSGMEWGGAWKEGFTDKPHFQIRLG